MEDLIIAEPLENPEWVDRIDNPEKYSFIENDNGTISTHRMAAETDGKGNWYTFPTIIQTPDGELRQFKDNNNALSYALRTGNYKAYTDKEEALEYAMGGYKTDKFKKHFEKLLNK